MQYRLLRLVSAALALSSPTAVRTAQPVAPQVQIREAATGVRISVAGAHAATWPTVEIGSVEIPAHLVAVGVDDATRPEPTIATLDCRPWAGSLRPSERPIPQANGQSRPDLAGPSRLAIRTTPITLVR